MKKVVIATWRMALEGITHIYNNPNNSALKDITDVIIDVENNQNYHSVGYGGLPNKEMEVELDAAIMCGRTLKIGAVGAIKNIKNPILVAEKLLYKDNCNFLVGNGAYQFAIDNGFKKENLLTEASIKKYKEEIKTRKELRAYKTHDTVGVVALNNGNIAAGTSTSGLFLKESGRVGDSPLPGSGYYCDNEIGGATATGLGEVIYRGIVSYEIVKLMKSGKSPSEACEIAVKEYLKNLERKGMPQNDISVVALNNNGEYGVYTNIKCFSFVVASDIQKPTVYLAKNDGKKMTIEEATQEWIDTHTE